MNWWGTMSNFCRDLIASAAITLALVPIASGADIPVEAPPRAPVPAALYNWTGFYVGGNGGYSWARSDIAIDEAFTLSGISEPVQLKVTDSLKPRGIIGGLQAGYNWQTGRNWVL